MDFEPTTPPSEEKGEGGREHYLEELRALLKKIFSDPGNRAGIIQTGINNSTITRWINGESEPRPANLNLILEHCSFVERQALQALSEKLHSTATRKELSPPAFPSIPAAFYARVHLALAETPASLRYVSIGNLVLKQALQHLDPERTGMDITLLKCVPSAKGTILCLQESLKARAFSSFTHYFLGAESLAGYAVASFQMAIEKRGIYYAILQEEASAVSAVAVPILQTGNSGGCLFIELPHARNFTPAEYALIKEYALLIGIAFETEDFYEKSAIRLIAMPPRNLQERILASFYERKLHLMRSRTMDNTQAEREVIQHIISELADSANLS